GGLADVLFAKGGADFQGRLPMAWPRSAKAADDALFPLGYGLTMAAGPTPWTPLGEDPGVAAESSTGVFLQRGKAAPGWTVTLTDPDTPRLRVEAVPAQTIGGRIAISAMDKDVQEGARQITLRAGRSAATIELEALSPVDLSRETNGDMMLVLTLWLGARPAAPVTLAARCGDAPCGAPVVLTETAGLRPGVWQDVAVPLKCLLPAGANSTRVTSPFVLSSKGALSLGLASVKLGTHAETVSGCMRTSK
uniref:putative glycoside hydrolase n=1 Tax=Novosphingobium sp. TaxID=1874826 RepID=UPI002615B483